MTVAVDPEKYHKLCDEIREFLLGATHDKNGQILTYCGKSIERIRGKLICKDFSTNLFISTSNYQRT